MVDSFAVNIGEILMTSFDNEVVIILIHSIVKYYVLEIYILRPCAVLILSFFFVVVVGFLVFLSLVASKLNIIRLCVE